MRPDEAILVLVIYGALTLGVLVLSGLAMSGLIK